MSDSAMRINEASFSLHMFIKLLSGNWGTCFDSKIDLFTRKGDGKGFIYKIYLQERKSVYLKIRTINLKA